MMSKSLSCSSSLWLHCSLNLLLFSITDPPSVVRQYTQNLITFVRASRGRGKIRILLPEALPTRQHWGLLSQPISSHPWAWIWFLFDYLAGPLWASKESCCAYGLHGGLETTGDRNSIHIRWCSDVPQSEAQECGNDLFNLEWVQHSRAQWQPWLSCEPSCKG